MLIYLQMIESEEDRTKFETIYRRYRFLMFAAAKKILGNAPDAEDAVHQAFLAIIENMNKVADADSPETRSFAVIITEHKALDMLRSRKHETANGSMETAVGLVDIPLPGDGGLADDMAALPARDREVLLLRYDNGYSAREIAKLLDLSEGAVQKRIWRAKEALKKQLGGEKDEQ